MSEQNVEFLHQAIQAFNRRDLDGFLAFMDSSVEFTPFTRAVEALGPYRRRGTGGKTLGGIL